MRTSETRMRRDAMRRDVPSPTQTDTLRPDPIIHDADDDDDENDDDDDDDDDGWMVGELARRVGRSSAPTDSPPRHSPLGAMRQSGRRTSRDHHACHVGMDETATTRQQKALHCLANRTSALPHSGSGVAGWVTVDDRDCNAVYLLAQSAWGDHDDGDPTRSLQNLDLARQVDARENENPHNHHRHLHPDRAFQSLLPVGAVGLEHVGANVGCHGLQRPGRQRSPLGSCRPSELRHHLRQAIVPLRWPCPHRWSYDTVAANGIVCNVSHWPRRVHRRSPQVDGVLLRALLPEVVVLGGEKLSSKSPN